jgi:hypothetical protein
MQDNILLQIFTRILNLFQKETYETKNKDKLL